MPRPAQVSLKTSSPSPVFTNPRAKCISGQEGQEGMLLRLLLLGGHGAGTRGWHWPHSPPAHRRVLGVWVNHEWALGRRGWGRWGSRDRLGGRCPRWRGAEPGVPGQREGGPGEERGRWGGPGCRRAHLAPVMPWLGLIQTRCWGALISTLGVEPAARLLKTPPQLPPAPEEEEEVLLPHALPWAGKGALPGGSWVL